MIEKHIYPFYPDWGSPLVVERRSFDGKKRGWKSIRVRIARNAIPKIS